MQHIAVKELVGENAMTLVDGEAIFRQIHDPLARGETVEVEKKDSEGNGQPAS